MDWKEQTVFVSIEKIEFVDKKKVMMMSDWKKLYDYINQNGSEEAKEKGKLKNLYLHRRRRYTRDEEAGLGIEGGKENNKRVWW